MSEREIRKSPEQRRTIRMERKLHTCRHWQGMFGQPPCAKGVDLVKLVGPRVRTGWANAIPCIANPNVAFKCEMKVTPTVEEVEAEEREREESIAHTMTVMASIPPGGKGSRGEVPCPKCGGTVRWMRSSYNGHLSGACPAGCVTFMQ